MFVMFKPIFEVNNRIKSKPISKIITSFWNTIHFNINNPWNNLNQNFWSKFCLLMYPNHKTNIYFIFYLFKYHICILLYWFMYNLHSNINILLCFTKKEINKLTLKRINPWFYNFESSFINETSNTKHVMFFLAYQLCYHVYLFSRRKYPDF